MPPKLAVHISAERLVEYQEAFDIFDPDGTGKMPAENVLQCMRKCGQMPSICEIEDLIRGVDKDNNAFAEGISYEQFCQIAAQKEKEIYTEDDILKAFRMFDAEAEGFLTMESLMKALCSQGEKLSEEEITAMINTAGIDAEGHINYELFVKAMMSKE